MRRSFLLALFLIPIAVVGVSAARADVQADDDASNTVDAASRWVLEFGPYAGYFDFDALTDYENFAVFGLRLGAHASSWLRLEGSFDEVYTERRVSGNSARQVSFNFHARMEPWPTRVAPFVLAGVALVILDDADDPDAYGEALDFGLGTRFEWKPQWVIRAEWLMRRQSFEVFRAVQLPDESPVLESEALSLWGRSLRVGISYVF